MLHILKNNRGVGHIDTGIKIIIAVVIGAVVLGGIYALFATVIIPEMNHDVQDMMHYEEDAVSYRYDTFEMSVNSLQYSYDGSTWMSANVPEYSDNAVIKKVVNSADGDMTLAMVVDNYSVYLIETDDNGANWKQVYSAGKYSTSTKPIKYSLSQRADGKYSMSIQTYDSKTATSGWLYEFKSDNGLVWQRDGSPWMVF